jgi:hypothetical protein
VYAVWLAYSAFFALKSLIAEPAEKCRTGARELDLCRCPML